MSKAIKRLMKGKKISLFQTTHVNPMAKAPMYTEPDDFAFKAQLKCGTEISGAMSITDSIEKCLSIEVCLMSLPSRNVSSQTNVCHGVINSYALSAFHPIILWYPPLCFRQTPKHNWHGYGKLLCDQSQPVYQSHYWISELHCFMTAKRRYKHFVCVPSKILYSPII